MPPGDMPTTAWSGHLSIWKCLNYCSPARFLMQRLHENCWTGQQPGDLLFAKTVISWVKDFGIDFCWLWPCCCSFPATNWLTCGPKLNAIRRVHSVWSRFVHSYALLVAQHNVETCQSKCWALVLQVLPVSSSKLCSYRVTTENVALFGHPTPEAVSKPGSSEFLGPSSLGDKMQLILIQLILAQRLREEFVWSQLSNKRDVGK